MTRLFSPLYRGLGKALLLVALLAALLFNTGGTAQAQNSGGKQSVHSTGMAGGYVVTASVKADGRLYTREFEPPEDPQDPNGVGTWSNWFKHGTADDWVNVDISLDDAGNAILIATKEGGSLWTRRSISANRWESWVSHGRATWSTTSSPSISMTSELSGSGTGPDATSRVVFSALKKDGNLYVREWSASNGWGGFQKVGAGNWAGHDVVMSPGTSRQIWLAATKTSGRLYTRAKTVGGNWGRWARHGADTWQTSTPPAIGLNKTRTPGGQDRFVAAVLAVKADGRMYSREWTKLGSAAGKWNGFIRHGAAGWASGSLGVDDNGLITVLATKNSGAMYMRFGQDELISGAYEEIWSAWIKLGASNWATEQPSIAVDRNRVSILGVKANGAIFSRDWNTAVRFYGWTHLGTDTWAI